ncbi:MAG TPA: hypothetical protein VNT54_14650, partial [Solirubrobacteraceae bacterium]|nr:hypothetical protein [Solirubrobacteraceae bacterium]
IGRVSANLLRPALGCVLLASALGVLKKAGVDVPPAALVGVPLVVGLGAFALLRSRIAPPPPEVEAAAA